MAAKKEEAKTEINFVAAQSFMKENYNKVNFVQRVKWPEDWGHIVPLYKEMYDTMAKGNRDPLPEKISRVKQETFARFEPDPLCERPLPPSTTKLYGWTGRGSVVQHADRWIKPHPQLSMYKELGWGWDSQH